MQAARSLVLVAGIAVALLVLPARLSAQSEKHIKDDNRFGCVDREYYEKLIKYIVDGDKEAFSHALAAAVITGQCTLFKVAEAVFITDTPIFHRPFQFSAEGKTTEYWT